MWWLGLDHTTRPVIYGTCCRYVWMCYAHFTQFACLIYVRSDQLVMEKSVASCRSHPCVCDLSCYSLQGTYRTGCSNRDTPCVCHGELYRISQKQTLLHEESQHVYKSRKLIGILVCARSLTQQSISLYISSIRVEQVCHKHVRGKTGRKCSLIKHIEHTAAGGCLAWVEVRHSGCD